MVLRTMSRVSQSVWKSEYPFRTLKPWFSRLLLRDIFKSICLPSYRNYSFQIVQLNMVRYVYNWCRCLSLTPASLRLSTSSSDLFLPTSCIQFSQRFVFEKVSLAVREAKLLFVILHQPYRRRGRRQTPVVKLFVVLV